MVPGEEHTHHRPVSPLGSEYQRRCDQSCRKVIYPPAELILEDRSPLWSHRNGLICLQTHSSMPSLFQLATRSLCNSDGCLSAGLVKGNKFCESPLGSDRSCIIASPTKFKMPAWFSGTSVDWTPWCYPGTVIVFQE